MGAAAHGVSGMKRGDKFKEGLALFNAGQFFQAHEAWEELWLSESGPEKMFLQGLIQMAAAFHHHFRGNRRGETSLLAAAMARLGRFPDGHRGLDLGRLRAEVAAWSKLADDGETGEARRPPRLHLLRIGSRSSRGWTPPKSRGRDA